MSIRQGGKVIAGNVSHYNIGDTFMTKRTDTSLAGAVECDGATYNTTDFTGDGSIGELLEAGKLDYVSLSAYSTAISTKGWCDKIGWDGTGNTVFRVPTLNAHIVQTNNIPVVGNGMVLGLSNGTVNFGCYKTTQNNYPRFALNSRDYGKNIGESAQDVTSSEGNDTTIGITTDGTKSGIIADTTDTAQLRVMIQIADGATDEALETCTSVLADVANLKDMSNVTSTGKATVVGWGMPDYANGVNLSNLDTYQKLNEDGFLLIQGSGGGNWNAIGINISLDGISNIYEITIASAYGVSYIVPVSKDLYIKRHDSYTSKLIFLPCKK